MNVTTNTPPKQITIGLDVGTGSKGGSPCAMAIYDGQKFVYTGEYRMPAEKDWLRRCYLIAVMIDQEAGREIALLDGPTRVVVGIEVPPMVKSSKTHFQLSVMWGMLLYTFRAYPVYEIYPTEGKAALSGSGSASKDDQVRNADIQFQARVTEHIADAMGIALATHAKRMMEDK